MIVAKNVFRWSPCTASLIHVTCHFLQLYFNIIQQSCAIPLKDAVSVIQCML